MSASKAFSSGNRVGILFTIISAALSIVATAFILCFALARAVRKYTGTSRSTLFEATDSSLFLNLMFADMLQAIGVMPSIRWLKNGSITDGPMCKNQGALKHIGQVAVAFSSLFIGLYTFYILVLRRIPPTHASKIGVVAVWIITGLICGVPNAIHYSKHEVFYGPTGFWCWIRYEWRTEQLATSYLWMWISAFGMVIIYGIIFCSIKGWIKTSRNGYFKDMFTTSQSSSMPEEPQYNRTRSAARLMLYFPLVYIITILPNSITRWLEFSGNKPASPVTLFANTIFVSSGLANFVLFFATRPRMVIGDKVVYTADMMSPRPQSHALKFMKEPYSPELESAQHSDSKLKHELELP